MPGPDDRSLWGTTSLGGPGDAPHRPDDDQCPRLRSPAIGIAIVDERLSLIINTGATIGALARLAIGSLTRPSPSPGLPPSWALGTVNGLVLMTLVLGRGPELGFSLDDPGAIPGHLLRPGPVVAAAMLLGRGLTARPSMAAGLGVKLVR